MNEKILFKPYRVDAIVANWILGATLGVSYVLALIFILLTTSVNTENVFLLLLLMLIETIFCVIVLCYCNKYSKITIIFEETRLVVCNSERREKRVFLWKSFRYAYYKNSYKGHRFLLLSANQLDYEEAKKIVNKSALSPKVLVDEAVVFPLVFGRCIRNIEEMVRRNVPTIIDYE